MTTTYLERILDPWREFDRAGRLFGSVDSNLCREYPAVNVWVNGENTIVTTEVPGIDKESIDISVSGKILTLSGTRPTDERKEGKSYHRHEIWHGDFHKTVQLPFNIDAAKVQASYKNGVLHVSLPQLEADKPKKIKIKSE